MLARLLAWVEDFDAGTVRLALLGDLPAAVRAELFEAGVLRGAPAATSIACPENADCAREVRGAGPGARLPLVAVCTREPAECAALDVGPDEVAQAVVDRAALARLLARLAQVPGEPRVPARAAPQELVRLGWLEEGKAEVFFLARPDATQLAAFLASRERAGAPVRVLVPTARRLPADLGARGEIVCLDDALTVEGERLVLRSVAPSPAARLRLVGGTAVDGAQRRPALPRAARWEDVRFEIEDNETVRVTVGERVARCTYRDLGMANEKTHRPKKQWHLFVDFLEGRGRFKGRGFGSVLATKRLVTTLRADLKAAFGIEESPIDDYVGKVGWVARFGVKWD